MKKSNSLFQSKLVLCCCFFLALGSFHASYAQSTSKWSYVREISIGNLGAQATDAVVLVELNSQNFDYTKAGENGSDIRFSLKPNALSGSGLSFWIEEWNKGGNSRIWVKLPKLVKGSDTRISMFYGNPNAKTASNGNTTFLFFDDFNDNNFTDKWVNQSIGTVVEEGGLLKLKEKDGENGMIMSNFDVTGQMIVHTMFQRENGDRHWVRAGISGWNQWLSWGDYYTTDGFADGYLMIFDASVKTLLERKVTLHPDDKWHRISYYYDGTKLKGARDADSVETTIPNATSKLGFMTLDNDASDFFDYIFVSKYITPEPIVKVGTQKASKVKGI